MTDRRPIRRALISVYDKTGLGELAAALDRYGVQIVSTGSTAEAIREAGVEVSDVADVTGFPEILDGRVKTLHPAIHAGILADVTKPSHQQALDHHGIAPFDLVVCNLYPFEQTVEDGASFEQIVEKIDIGGPTIVRGAAKNFATCAVVLEPGQYALIAQGVASGGFTRLERLRLASIAFSRIEAYDSAIATWMREQSTHAGLGTGASVAEGEVDQHARIERERGEAPDGKARRAFTADMPESAFALTEAQAREQGVRMLRYGENAHQRAFVATAPGPDAEGALASAECVGGKAMSYNNYVDADAALGAAFDHDAPAVAIIKHNNPCGVAIASPGGGIEDAYVKAHASDPVSAFGGVIAANRPVNLAMARAVAEVFTEVIVAPGYEEGAIEELSRKKNMRILTVKGAAPYSGLMMQRAIWGGVLHQERDRFQAPGDDPSTWTLVSGDAASEDVMRDLAFAWRAVRAPKSNAIVLARDGASVGIGMGQVNRVDACALAVQRANTHPGGVQRARGSVAASDAFFPFADGPRYLIDAGVRAIVQPGGSVRDDEVIAACQEAGLTMYVTGTRHFSH